jgi:Na+-transporting methylmalonyl-CoA/oxaloacetate decarboxylase gamma subunit
MVDIALVSRLEQGMSLSVLLVLFVLIAALYAVNQVGERRTP